MRTRTSAALRPSGHTAYREGRRSESPVGDRAVGAVVDRDGAAVLGDFGDLLGLRRIKLNPQPRALVRPHLAVAEVVNDGQFGGSSGSSGTEPELGARIPISSRSTGRIRRRSPLHAAPVPASRVSTAVRIAVRVGSQTLHFQGVTRTGWPLEPHGNSPPTAVVRAFPPTVHDPAPDATGPRRAGHFHLAPPRGPAHSTTDRLSHPRPSPPAPDSSPHRPALSPGGPDQGGRRRTFLATGVRCANTAG